ncbi:MAG: chemotaxis protein CheW [Deltaproteobacteria bacterium]|nr:chemotaxis protein CheW [Deltaproteobacteria bacterium]
MAVLENQWVIFNLAGNQFGLSLGRIREMTKLGHVNQLPQTPAHVMGTMKLRDKVLPILDLRLRLGLPSLEQDNQILIDLFTAREQDHVNWIQALEKSVNESIEFKMARDPHKCAFGKWYDTFTTTDLVIAGELKKFDLPHQRIHALANQALNLCDRGQPDQARDLIEKTRTGDLTFLRGLFSNIRDVIRQRTFQIAIILEEQNRIVGLAVDEILSVSKINSNRIQPLPVAVMSLGENFIIGAAQMENSRQNILLLDSSKLLAMDQDI